MDRSNCGIYYFSGVDPASMALVAGVCFDADLGWDMAAEMLTAYPLLEMHTLA